MRQCTLFRWAAALTLAIALAPGAAPAQEDDTLSISGSFYPDTVYNVDGLGADLAEVYANANNHSWTLTLHGVTYSHDRYNDDWWYGYDRGFITRVHATSIDFEFFGPDAEVLNHAVSQQLAIDNLPNSAIVELRNGEYYDPFNWPDDGPWPYSEWNLWLVPIDPDAGVYFSASGVPDSSFSTDESGYPLVEPQILDAVSAIVDTRSGYYAALQSSFTVVDIGSAPPVLTLSIRDTSVWEGNKGTTWLDLAVTLSQSSNDVVGVNYATANSTALAGSDYTATSGTLIFLPGETSRTISIAIKGDRKREPDEVFYVELFDAVGATISDAVATVTILNDD
jgi:hypothetical protein